MNKTIATALLGAVLTWSLPAWAHTDEYLDTIAAPHGGQLIVDPNFRTVN